MKDILKAPFPFFGGKSMIAKIVWDALGQPRHYLEPFFGSGAVLLQRPNYDKTKHTETICDKDGFICNVWRSLIFNPDEVAKWCDWPVNHVDLAARRNVLIKNEEYLLQNLITDDKFFDPILAGYWIWSTSCWIGSGLIKPYNPLNSKKEHNFNILGPIPSISNTGHGICSVHKGDIYKYFNLLSNRLRYVRVVCGDWTRICGGEWQDKIGMVGIFFDPPYGIRNRTKIYHKDSFTVSSKVKEWCLERGHKASYRIVLCGYEEYEDLLNYGWTKLTWKGSGGYANSAKNNTQGKINRSRETVYFSPYCQKDSNNQKLL